MIYWDTSALLASFILEQGTTAIRSFVVKLGEIRSYTAIITPIELESAIQRRLNDRSLTAKEADQARLLAADFRRNTFLIVADHSLLDTALHLQKIYGLRPCDAIQLASARIGVDDPARVQFLCLDTQLNEAAKREGFSIAEF